MLNRTKFIVSHAPFWHNGSNIAERNYHMMLAALPAVILGLIQYKIPALAVMSLAVSSAILWELAFCRITKSPDSIGDGNAAMLGMVFGMLLPATAPWWLVITGTFIVIIVGKKIFGGIGAYPYHPAVVAIAILMVSWGKYFDFDAVLIQYNFDFAAAYPLATAKYFGAEAVSYLSPANLIMGKQTGAIGATFGLGLMLGGLYLIVRGFIRWEIAISFLAGVFLTALLFNAANPVVYAGPAVHLLTGYTLIGAFFLATEDSSSPVNFVPMLLYGALAGFMTVLIRNIGAYVDGVILAILLLNCINPLLDKIRPKALGKVV